MGPHTQLVLSLATLMILELGHSAPIVGPSMLVRQTGLITLRCATEDWTLVGDFCYYSTNETTSSWLEALDLCTGDGAELVSILGSPDDVDQPFSVEDLMDAEVVMPGMSLWIAQTVSSSMTMDADSQSGTSLASTSTTTQTPTVCPYVTVGADGMAQWGLADCSTSTMSTVCVTVPSVSMSILVTSANASDYNTGTLSLSGTDY
ncbi:hypothetical protein RvY_12770 [Ramazzottius varieornatus]|uniref:C-type lectin domain-containing protein n=1 Tax=Ramazzottius varieornatus TaxID=947166 RepID=A0A1D1VPR2_RAMVA|nr:hypothetical protein RvY_12770 [Ramazzottius varieornatus]